MNPHTPALWVDNCQCEACVKRRQISAAAPDLLEALQVLTQRAQALDQSATASGLTNCDALAKAHAAIAKATNP
jgi:hypothetical protein